MKIVIADKVSPSALKVFAEHPDWTIVSPDKESLARELADADGIVVRSATFVNDVVMEKAPKLRVIGRAGVGVDNVDLEAATRHGIVVMNTPGGNAVAVAEHTFALMLAMARFIHRAHTTTAAGKWEKKSAAGNRTARQNAGHRRAGPCRRRSAETCAGLRYEGGCPRSIRRTSIGAAA